VLRNQPDKQHAEPRNGYNISEIFDHYCTTYRLETRALAQTLEVEERIDEKATSPRFEASMVYPTSGVSHRMSKKMEY
jgi:hypothetical protein